MLGRIGKCYKSQSGKALILRIPQQGSFRVLHYSIAISSLKRLLEGTRREIPITKVHD